MRTAAPGLAAGMGPLGLMRVAISASSRPLSCTKDEHHKLSPQTFAPRARASQHLDAWTQTNPEDRSSTGCGPCHGAKPLHFFGLQGSFWLSVQVSGVKDSSQVHFFWVLDFKRRDGARGRKRVWVLFFI